MRHSEGRFTGARARSIYFQCWEPETVPTAVLLTAHGAGEHSARYRNLARYFTGHNYVVGALDHNGHGYSEGIPGHVDSFDDYLHDIAMFHQELIARYPRVPLFFLGHSMGGLIACNYLLNCQSEFAGAVLSGAAIKTELEPGRIQMALLRLCARIMPRLGILKLNATGVSRDESVVREYVQDPLVFHGKMSARMCRELFEGMHRIQAQAGRITLPVLILHGSADSMTAPEGSVFLERHVSSSDRTLKLYPGLFHEIFNEPERISVLDDVRNWCASRI
jgi:alpha-beta hydrolase superfamily lysophospholipase